MNASAKIHLTPAKVKGKYVIRFVANQENCNEEQIENAWKTIQEFASDILIELTPQKKRPTRPALRKLDRTHSQRFSFTRNVSQELYERQSSMYVATRNVFFYFNFNNDFIFINRQKLMDGATPIVVIDTDDILKSLQRATQKNKEAAQELASPIASSDVKPQSPRNHTNGSV